MKESIIIEDVISLLCFEYFGRKICEIVRKDLSTLEIQITKAILPEDLLKHVYQVEYNGNMEVIFQENEKINCQLEENSDDKKILRCDYSPSVEDYMKEFGGE